MEVLVRCVCECTVPRWACPNCQGKGHITRWIPMEALSLLTMPYFIMSRRFAPTENIKRVAV